VLYAIFSRVARPFTERLATRDLVEDTWGDGNPCVSFVS